MSRCRENPEPEVTTRVDWRRFNGAWRWGVAIPTGTEVLRIVCPKCDSQNARSDRISDDVYSWCTKYCGWEDAKRITIEWRQEWKTLRARCTQKDIR